jgi:hypothetical protein
MNDTKATPRIGCRVQVNVSIGGKVEVLTFHHQPEGGPGWFPGQQEAWQDAAKRMRHLAHELLRQADYLTQDPRGI